MNSRLLQSLKDPFKLSLVVSTVFFAGILLSAYVMYILPNDMMNSQAIDIKNISLARVVLVKMYMVIGLTFVAGILALYFSTKAKKEIIVYREKEREAEKTKSQQLNGNTDLESSDTANFREAIATVKGDQDILQEGLNLIANQFQAGQAALYVAATEGDQRLLRMRNGFAFATGENQTLQFEFGEGLVGQAAATGKSLYIDEIPQGYITILSGLGNASPRFLFIVALKKGNEIIGVLEVAVFSALKELHRKQIEEMAQVLAEHITESEVVEKI